MYICVCVLHPFATAWCQLRLLVSLEVLRMHNDNRIDSDNVVSLSFLPSVYRCVDMSPSAKRNHGPRINVTVQIVYYALYKTKNEDSLLIQYGLSHNIFYLCILISFFLSTRQISSYFAYRISTKFHASTSFLFNNSQNGINVCI